MHALHHVPTSDLMYELARRTIVDDNMDASPHSLLQLVCLMASVLSTRQRVLVSEALRDAADGLENPRVHVW